MVGGAADREEVDMSFDPDDPAQRPPRRPRPQLARRDVLLGALWAGLGIGAAPLLAACGNNASSSLSANGGAPYPLARPDHPVTLTIKSSNPPIKDGLPAETGGTFQILNYADYMAPAVMKAFGKKH